MKEYSDEVSVASYIHAQSCKTQKQREKYWQVEVRFYSAVDCVCVKWIQESPRSNVWRRGFYASANESVKAFLV